MVWTVVALAMTVLMGGIIAYNGDVIGRRYGKRRVSLFGLRPKHTAILITSLTGVFISALTTGTLFLLVPPVREIILEGGQALQNNIRYKREIVGLRKDKGNLDVLVSAQRQALKDTEIKLDGLQRNLQQAQARLIQEQTNLRRVQNEKTQAQAETRAAQADAKAARQAEQAAQAKTSALLARSKTLSDQISLLQKINTALANQNTGLAQQNKTLTEGNQAEAKRNAALKKQNEAIAQQNDAMAQQNVELLRNNATLLRVNNSLIRDRDGLMTQNQGLSTKNAEMARESRALEDRWKGFAGNLIEMFEAMRTRRVAVHGGDELARAVIPAGSPPQAVRQAIESLRHDAHLTALARGAGPGDQKALAVQVVDKSFYERSENGGARVVQVTEADRINGLVSRVAYSDVPVCVLALAVANTVEREPAAIDFQPFSNRLIYPKGRVIATRLLDATQPSDRVFSELVAFLKDIGETARNRGMIPFIDPTTGEPQVGSLGAADLVVLVERIRAEGRRVQVRAVAAADVNAADLLRMDFKIESVL